MPAIFTAITKVGSQSWKYEWTGTTPYQVYRQGKLIDTVDDAEYTIEVYGATDEPPVIEVLDDDDVGTAQSVLYPCRVTLQWRGVSGADSYVIYKYVDAAWVEQAYAMEVSAGYYTHESGCLDDVTASQWRVTAKDTHNNESDPISFTLFVVRNPDLPDLDLSYDAVDGELDIAAG